MQDINNIPTTHVLRPWLFQRKKQSEEKFSVGSSTAVFKNKTEIRKGLAFRF